MVLFETEASEGLIDQCMTISERYGVRGWFPKSRVVLLKKIYLRGFIFYTNYESEKESYCTYPNVMLFLFFGPLWSVS